MSRVARIRSISRIYHVVTRGVNRSNLFEEDADKEYFLKVLFKLKDEIQFELYGHCLMDNHIHLLIKEGKQDISKIMQRLLSSYAVWYNNKYERCGHLYGGRFKSEPIDDFFYLFACLRYILHNPEKANMRVKNESYKWSSFKEYESLIPIKTNIKFILDLFKRNYGETIDFRTYMRIKSDVECIDLDYPRWVCDSRALSIILKCANIFSPFEIQTFDNNKRKDVIKKILSNIGISCRQIARITGIPLHIVLKVSKA